ncbi:hypothetical protein AaE_015292 [Aphanomyces astaci]|uniref:Uncharacterized protein n=1 Tax=Aphanomyces astaci TaxID=112090 RepID=A0A6A4YWJ5_APHAT|nr:hypothetical protein AaE_015292 [Aphanomyces astaci]
MADATARASAVPEAHAQAMRMMEARAQQAEETSMLSVMYEQMKDERNAGVHRFCNWVAGQVTVVGFDNLFPLVEAWGYECGWHQTADGKTAITKLLDEFKASSGVMVVPVPAAATTPLPLPQTSVAEVGGDKVNDGCNGATALSLERADGKTAITKLLDEFKAYPGSHPFRREGQANDPRYTRIGEAIAKTEIHRRVNRRGGRFKFPDVGFPVHRNFGRRDKCVEAGKISRQRRVLTPNNPAPGQNSRNQTMGSVRERCLVRTRSTCPAWRRCRHSRIQQTAPRILVHERPLTVGVTGALEVTAATFSGDERTAEECSALGWTPPSIEGPVTCALFATLCFKMFT